MVEAEYLEQLEVGGEDKEAEVIAVELVDQSDMLHRSGIRDQGVQKNSIFTHTCNFM